MARVILYCQRTCILMTGPFMIGPSGISIDRSALGEGEPTTN